MQKFLLVITFVGTALCTQAQTDVQDLNKSLAQGFYQDLWFGNNTGNFSRYVADEYVVHDVGDRKNQKETAIEQKKIADFFWKNGEMNGTIDYMIAEGDRVATRWIWHYKPKTLLGRIFIGSGDMPIINVFRFKDGKIVEIWNHRHDIDGGSTIYYTGKGFLYGLLVSLIPLFFLVRLWRKQKRERRSMPKTGALST